MRSSPIARPAGSLRRPVGPEQTRLGAYCSVHLLTRFEDAREDWLSLERQATISPYQSFEFLSAWFTAFGSATGATPFLICARDADGCPSALLPFAVSHIRLLRIATYLGGRETNFNLPLLRPDAPRDEDSLRWLLSMAASRTPAPPDLFYLRNQPRRFEKADNPLVFAHARPAMSMGYATALPSTIDQLAARSSKDALKKLSKKRARLAEMGPLAYEHRATGARAHAIVDALIKQKSARFPAWGMTARRCLSALLHHLVDAGSESLELHALCVDDRIVAAYAGMRRGSRFSAMLNSYDMQEQIARCSPGDLLLHALLQNLVERGLTHFDLGAGEARYKKAVCDETIALYDMMLPISARGALAAPLLFAFLQIKRRARRAPKVARAYERLKTALGSNCQDNVC